MFTCHSYGAKKNEKALAYKHCAPTELISKHALDFDAELTSSQNNRIRKILNAKGAKCDRQEREGVLLRVPGVFFLCVLGV